MLGLSILRIVGHHLPLSILDYRLFQIRHSSFVIVKFAARISTAENAGMLLHRADQEGKPTKGESDYYFSYFNQKAGRVLRTTQRDSVIPSFVMASGDHVALRSVRRS
jgi:hypothetical protein